MKLLLHYLIMKRTFKKLFDYEQKLFHSKDRIDFINDLNADRLPFKYLYHSIVAVFPSIFSIFWGLCMLICLFTCYICVLNWVYLYGLTYKQPV